MEPSNPFSLPMPLNWELLLVLLVGMLKMIGSISVNQENTNLLLLLMKSKQKNLSLMSISNMKISYLLKLTTKITKPNLPEISVKWFTWTLKEEKLNITLTKLFSNSQLNTLLMKNNILENFKFGTLLNHYKLLLFHSLLIKMMNSTMLLSKILEVLSGMWLEHSMLHLLLLI